MISIVKKFCLFLAFTLIMTLVTACNDSSSGRNTPESSSTIPQGDETVKEGPSWTWDTTPVKLTWFVDQDWYKKTWDIQNCLLDKKITEETGVTIEITSGNGDKFNALIASDSLPDIVSTWIGSSQRQVLEKNKMVLPFNELVANYAPDFKVPQSMQDWFRNEDGNYYGYVNYFYAPEEMQEGNYYVTHNNFRIRKDIADKLGIKVSDFDTKEGTLEALRKVRDSKIQYNGLDIIPFYPCAGTRDLLLDVQYLAQQFGAAYEDAEGNWLDWRMQPETLEALKFYNTLYHEELMPTDAVTLKIEQKGAKVANGSVFMIQGRQVENQWNELESRDENAVYLLVGPIRGDEGKTPYLTTSGLTGWTMTMITKNAKRPDRAVRFLNYMTQPENILQTWWGPEGATWDMVDGHVVIKPEVEEEYKKDWAAANLKYGDKTFEWLVSWLPIQRTYPIATKQYVIDNEKYEKEVYGKYVFDDKCFSDITVEAGTEEAGIYEKLNTYWISQVAKIIVADPGDVTMMYHEAVEKSKELGWQKFYDATNARFKWNKAKLGIEFAYPPNMK